MKNYDNFLTYWKKNINKEIVFSYSLRRFYVDFFYFKHLSELPANIKVLDIGGVKIRKRGLFNIQEFPYKTLTTNLTREKKPDFQSNAMILPLEDNVFDYIICSEVLEHISQPEKVLKEMQRVLKKGGSIYICVPFLYPIHSDPEDYARFTDYYWQKALLYNGFTDIVIEKQGYLWSVFADIIREIVRNFMKYHLKNSGIFRAGISEILRWILEKAINADRKLQNIKGKENFQKYTTGFGIRALKK